MCTELLPPGGYPIAVKYIISYIINIIYYLRWLRLFPIDVLCSEVVWRVVATHSIYKFSLHFPSRASQCAIIFELDSTNKNIYAGCTFLLLLKLSSVSVIVMTWRYGSWSFFAAGCCSVRQEVRLFSGCRTFVTVMNDVPPTFTRHNAVSATWSLWFRASWYHLRK
jgi:hypothetical protein